jgi:phage shock protein A
MRRFRDITLATFNDMLEKSEDPVRLIDQYLTVQCEQIMESEKIYQQLANHVQQLKHQYLQAEQLMNKREDQAKTALKAGEEQLARIALQEKVMHEERSEQYRTLYEQGLQSKEDLEDQLRQLKADYQSVYDKRHFYAARLESIRLQQQMNERLNHIGSGGGTPRMFQRLEDKLTDMELEARSLRELRKTGQELAAQVGSTLQSAIDKEFQQLKRKLEQEGWMSR